jgi:hypothetical protein
MARVMKRASLMAIKQAVAKAVGFRPESIEAGEREYAHDPRAYGFNVLKWAPDADLSDLSEVDEAFLQDLDYTDGVMLDLYVNSGDGLSTNVTLILASDFSVVAAYDSVTDEGMEFDLWWTQGQMTHADLRYAIRNFVD